MSDTLKMKIKDFPNSPGVYQFIGSAGEILYIGKAKNLRNRVRSYFLKEIGRGAGIDQMVSLASDLKFFETESEIEALLLEADLIRRIKPKYNARLKDDKSFLIIKITKEDFPRIDLVRYHETDLKDKTAWFFGPYPSGDLLRKSMKILRKIFPYRDCSKTKYRTYKKKGRPCIYGDIRICAAPCVDWVSPVQYKKNIVHLKEFLKGNKRSVYLSIEREMKKLSQKKRFEEASLLRNQLYALDHLKEVGIGIRDDLFNGNNSIFKRVECYDISNILGQYAVGAMTVFIDGKKSSSDYRKFKIKFSDTANDLLMMREVLERRFHNDWPKPDLLVIDGGVNHLKVAKEVLKANELKIPVISIAKGPKRDKNEINFSDEAIAKYFHKNSYIENVVISARDEAHRFGIAYYRKLHQKGMFN